MNGWEDGEGDKESGEDIETLGKTLLEHIPVGNRVDHAVPLLLL